MTDKDIIELESFQKKIDSLTDFDYIYKQLNRIEGKLNMVIDAILER